MANESKNGMYYINLLIKLAIVVLVVAVAIVLLLHFLDDKSTPNENKLSVETNNRFFEIGEEIEFPDLVVKMYKDGNILEFASSDYELDLSNVNKELAGSYQVKVVLKSDSEIFGYFNISLVDSRLQIENYNTMVLIGNEYVIGNYTAFVINRDGTKTNLDTSILTVDTTLINKNSLGEYDLIVSYPDKNLTVVKKVTVVKLQKN